MAIAPASTDANPGTVLEQLLHNALAAVGLSGTHTPSRPNRRPLRALVFSGWGHKPDAINGIIPPEIGEVVNFDYRALRDGNEVIARLREQHPEPDVVIGWSLGGLLAVRAVAEGALHPKLLVLLATPQRSVEGLEEKFRASPEHFLNGFLDKMLRGESQPEIRNQL